LPARRSVTMLPAMFVVTEADAAAIRTVIPSSTEALGNERGMRCVGNRSARRQNPLSRSPPEGGKKARPLCGLPMASEGHVSTIRLRIQLRFL
jgi:hypothetical protein